VSQRVASSSGAPGGGRGIRYYDMVGIPDAEDRNEDDPYYGVYRFKIGFCGEVTDFLGCLDLPIKNARAGA
jgi:peptidoglycan pentaglycine glycine transferase (the first glycine)